MNVEETEINLVDYFNILRKRGFLILMSILTVVTIVSIYVYFQKDLYLATTKVLFEHTDPAATVLNQPYYMWSQKIVPEIEKEMILNSAIIGNVIEELGLTKNPPGSPQWHSLVRKLINYIRITFLNTQQANIVYGSRMLANLIATTPDPNLSKDLLETIVSTYQDNQRRYKIEKDYELQEWLDKQMSEAKNKIEEAEWKFQKFKQDKGILSIKELQQAHIDNFAILNNEYQDALRERKNIELQLRNLNDALNKGFEVSNLVFSNNNFSTITKYLEELNDLYVESENAKKTYKKKHPIVIDIDQKISKTKEKLKQAKTDIIKSLEIQLRTAKKLEDIKLYDMKEYKEQALEISHDELQYKLLEREVETSRHLYDLLATQLKESSIQNSVSIVDLRVVEPPVLPRKPLSKKYPMKLTVAIIIGLLLGVAISFLIEFIDISVKSPDDVKRYLNVPVAGIIPHIDTTFDEGRIEELTNLMVRNYEEQVTK